MRWHGREKRWKFSSKIGRGLSPRSRRQGRYKRRKHPFSVSSSTPATPSSNTNQSSNGPLNSRYSPMPGRIKRQRLGRIWCLKAKHSAWKKADENARFLWNFGDGTTKEGKSVLYAYKYRANTSSFLMFRRAIFRQATEF